MAIVIPAGQQVMLTEVASRFFRKVQFDPGGVDAHRLQPAGRTSPVVIDPLVRFGRPSVAAVVAERLGKLFDAGEPIEQLAEGYDLDVKLIHAAIAYEEHQRLLAA